MLSFLHVDIAWYIASVDLKKSEDKKSYKKQNN